MMATQKLPLETALHFVNEISILDTYIGGLKAIACKYACFSICYSLYLERILSEEENGGERVEVGV